MEFYLCYGVVGDRGVIFMLWCCRGTWSYIYVVVLQENVELYVCCGVAGDSGVIFMLWCCRGTWKSTTWESGDQEKPPPLPSPPPLYPNLCQVVC